VSVNASQNLAADYSSKATAYQRCWAPVIRPMARPLLAALPLYSARQVLDLGCGTGELLQNLRAEAPRSHLHGVDRSEGMLRMARATSISSLSVMDAESLALGSETIDVAMVAFVLFHLRDPVSGLREIRRVLRPWGIVGIVVWGKCPDVPGVAIWNEELDQHGAAEDPREQSVMQHAEMDTTEKLSGLVRLSGLVPLRVWSELFEHRWTPEVLVEMQVGCGMPGRRLATLSEPARTACRQRAEARIRRLPSAELVFRPEALFAKAQRSG